MSAGVALPHDSARLHVTGAAAYVGDAALPGNALHLAFGLSAVARGRIEAMDLDPVRSAPGVVAVLTAEDMPGENDVSPSPSPEPLLAEGEVHYVGQPLFIVAATSHLAARKAARLANIDYVEETPVLTMDETIAAGDAFEDAPLVWGQGDAAAAIERAPRVIEGRIDIGGQEHFYLEGQCAHAIPGDDGAIFVASSSQHPTEVQHKVAEALDRPMSDVRVEVRRMGGGFGGKESQGNHLAVACAVVAAATGRPVAMRYDRDDDMVVTGKRHDFRILYRAGFEESGRLCGVEFTHYARCGWSQDLSLPVADRAMLHSDNAYHLPDVRIESHRLRSNTQSATAFRGFGGPQGMAGIERVMDQIAFELGRDPVEVRRANYYADMKDGKVGRPPSARPAGARRPAEDISRPMMDEDAASRGISETREAVVDGAEGGQTTPYGMEVRDFILGAMTERLLKTSDYHARREAVAKWNAEHDVLKRGIAFSPVKFGISFTLTHLNQAGALVHLYQDGSIAMNHGGTEMGQGLFQKVAQVAAHAFGVEPERVRITATDTAKVPNTSATAASSGADLNGMAVAAACEELKRRIAEFLASRAQADPRQVRFEDGRVRLGGEDMSFAEAIKACYVGRVSLSATGFYATPDIVWDRVKGVGRPFYYFAHGCAVTEVVLDRLTGENRMLRVDILHDAGASLNPAIDRGQIEGGFIQGVGWLTTEELVWDDKGRLSTHAPSTYKIPAASDRPDVFNVELWDGRNREDSIHRSKAVGEPPLMLGLSAWLALSHAVASCGTGYPALDLPVTAERLAMAIRETEA